MGCGLGENWARLAHCKSSACVHGKKCARREAKGALPPPVWAELPRSKSGVARLPSFLSLSLCFDWPEDEQPHSMAGPTTQALTQHLLSRLDADLEFLASAHLLSPADLALIRSKLAPIHAHEGLAALAVSPAPAQAQRQVPPPPPPPVRAQQQQQQQPPAKPLCRAVWDYVKTQVRPSSRELSTRSGPAHVVKRAQPDDLGFKQGDVITVDDEVNADWWRGTLDGETGLFPCNHVERIAAPSPSPTPSPAQGYAASYAVRCLSLFVPVPAAHKRTDPRLPQAAQPSWAPPAAAAAASAPSAPSFAYQQPQAYGAAPSSYGNEKASYYAPPPPPPQQQQQQPYGGYQPPAPAPAPAQQVVVQPDGAQKKHKYGKFGKQMGTAIAGGAGFGVGASALALGSKACRGRRDLTSVASLPSLAPLVLLLPPLATHAPFSVTRIPRCTRECARGTSQSRGCVPWRLARVPSTPPCGAPSRSLPLTKTDTALPSLCAVRGRPRHLLGVCARSGEGGGRGSRRISFPAQAAAWALSVGSGSSALHSVSTALRRGQSAASIRRHTHVDPQFGAKPVLRRACVVTVIPARNSTMPGKSHT